eukprot:maker-scaffold616_size123561-snap-gene-0.18 protein:Tk05719 transcript:maker-scaffold616_size123561-snap-gene-0.18-mRNA-1 annotation:"hypothetical protein BRAFLDRAFT_122922"
MSEAALRRPLLYGSQTGTAQEVAERIYREAKRLHFKAKVLAMDEYHIPDLIEETLGVFVCSTTGQGDEPDNMKAFWKFLLRKNLPKESLKALRFGVLGLGDSSYQKFNFVGKKLHKRMAQLGAIPLQTVGLGDDQHDLGPDSVIDPWLKSFWNKALEIYPLPPGLEPIPVGIQPESRFKVSLGAEAIFREQLPPFNERFDQHNPFRASVVKNVKQTSEGHFQDTRLIEFDISHSQFSYNPGDVCMLQPSNLAQTIDFFFDLFPYLDPNERVSLAPNDPNVPLPPAHLLPPGSTLRDCAVHFWDLQAIPGRYFFELLSHFTQDEMEKEKLIEFTTAEGQQDLYDYCNRPRRNILEVAERIYREAKRLHFKAKVLAMDEYHIPDLIEETLGVFVCSTTGQGDEPDNMKAFWKFLLRKNLPKESLKALRFGVLGLGDSSYQKFNFVGKKLHKRMAQLGAIPLQTVGLGDDQHDLGPDSVIDPWLKSFWNKALEIYPLPPGLEPIPVGIQPESRFKVSLGAEAIFREQLPPFNERFDQHNPFRASVVKNLKQTSEGHFQDSRLIEFDISHSQFSFDSGDVCMLQPSNLAQTIDVFFDLFPYLDPNERVSLAPNDPNVPLPPAHLLPPGSTLRDCAVHFWDLQAIPGRYFFELLSHFTQDEMEKEKLIEFTTAEGQQDLYDYCNRPRRNILEVLIRMSILCATATNKTFSIRLFMAWFKSSDATLCLCMALPLLTAGQVMKDTDQV